MIAMLDVLKTHPFFFFSSVGFVSLFVGSFLNVVIYRLPCILFQNWRAECIEAQHFFKKIPIPPVNFTTPLLSHCPVCQCTIKPWHNIPIISFLFLKGKCIACNTKIAWRYPLVECLSLILSLYVVCHFGLTVQSIFALFFTWILIALVFIDLEHQLLPDQLNYILLWLGLFLSLFYIFTTPQDAIIGAIIAYLSLFLIAKLFKCITQKEGMGHGDFKLFAALGAFMGWQTLAPMILIASLLGIVGGVIQMSLRRHFKSVPMAFGPYLAMSGWMCLLWGPEISHLFYLRW